MEMRRKALAPVGISSCLAVMAVFAGCSEQAAIQPQTTGMQNEDIPVARTPQLQKEMSEEVAAVHLRLADRAEYEAALAAHRGKVVLVDFWATWCIPCIQAFPHTVEWSRKYAEKGLAVISVSLDDPDEQGNNAQALGFLKSKGATFQNLLSRHGADAPSFEAFDISSGGIPYYKLFDREGQVIQSFGNDDPDHPLDPKEIEAAVRQALVLAPATE